MTVSDDHARDREIDLLDLLAALNAGKRLIIFGTLALCALAAGLSFFLPNEYLGRVQLLPPKEQRQGFGFSELLSALPIPSLRLGEKGTPADIFVAILESPSTRRRMVRDFDLMRVYEAELLDDAIEALEGVTTVGKSEQGTIMIEVLDRDPQRAAAMANHYVVLLDSTNQSLSRQSAKERYEFILRLKADEQVRLQEAMDRLQKFQEEHNAVAIDDQARAVIRQAAEMQAAAAELEIARQNLIASGFAPDHAQVQKAEMEYKLRQQALAFLRDGVEFQVPGSGGGRVPKLELQESLFLPLRDIPRVAQEYAQIEKDVLVETALIKLLLQQEAEALIEANNTTSTVQVLDVASVPERKARPRRFLIVFITGILSLFASTAYVLSRQYVLALQARWRAEHRS